MANMLKALLGNVLLEVAAVIVKRAYALCGKDVRDASVILGLARVKAPEGETRGTEHLN